MSISFKPNLLSTLPERYLIEDSLQSRNEMLGTCAIRFEKKNKTSEDDYDGHAYSIIGINKININSKLERVYTLR